MASFLSKHPTNTDISRVQTLTWRFATQCYAYCAVVAPYAILGSVKTDFNADEDRLSGLAVLMNVVHVSI